MAIELAERTDSGSMFQRERAQGPSALVPVLVLILGTDRVIPQFDLNQSINPTPIVPISAAKPGSEA